MTSHSGKGFISSAFITMIFSCVGIFHGEIPFMVQVSQLSATEGSCADIKCSSEARLSSDNAKWFWMKDSVWNKIISDYVNITYVYSSNHPDVNSDFSGRVEYIGTEPPWREGQACSIRICDLRMTDSGRYRFRFVGEAKYSTEDTTLTVTKNTCPIDFPELPVLKEFQETSLICSTLSQCPFHPQIQGVTQLPESWQENGKKISSVKYEAAWQDNGKEIRCQTPDNTDQHLVKKFNLTVEYAPRDVVATRNPPTVKEGQTATLICSAKGNPAPTFTWFKNDNVLPNQEFQLVMTGLTTEHDGWYSCEARNTHGSQKSQTVSVMITYPPEVEIEVTRLPSQAREGDEMILECQVKRSNPAPWNYRWYKNSVELSHAGTRYRKTLVATDKGVYTCAADNTAGPSPRSQTVWIDVQYGPRKPNIKLTKNEVKVGHSVAISCDTTAKPAPTRYTWYRHTTHGMTSMDHLSTGKTLYLFGMQRGDEACYTCSATNSIKTGERSKQACIKVLYPPTNLQLLVDPEVQEDHLVTISCSVESWPLSQLTLEAEASSAFLPLTRNGSNVLNYTLKATPAHRGTYTCRASNGKGPIQIKQRELVVKYAPRDVRFQASAALIMKENSTLTLRCSASAYPEPSFTWWKVTPEPPERLQTDRTLVFKSLRASDSGRYWCSASNQIGTRDSEVAEVKVMYVPKLTSIVKAAEQPGPDGRSLVMLSCSSHCYPAATQFSWFRRMKDDPESRGTLVSSHQNFTVYSDTPGYYYCTAGNEMGESSSDAVLLFVEGGFIKSLKYIFLFAFILILLIILIVTYRQRKRKSVRGSSKTTSLRFRFRNGRPTARTRLREPALGSNSGEEPTYTQPSPRRRAHVTPKCELAVYSTVNLPATNPGGSNGTEDSLNYALLHFNKGQKTQEPKAEDKVIYCKVAKRKGDDDTNMGGAPAALGSNVYSWDSDTSEEETAVNYTQVNFPTKAGHAGTRKDSSSSERDEANYSEVKV